MAGTRDILIHEYFAVDLKVVLRTVREDFPRDKKYLRRILDDLGDDE